MSYEPPTPLADIPTGIINNLSEAPSDWLRAVVSYAGALAEHKERKARTQGESNEADVEN